MKSRIVLTLLFLFSLSLFAQDFFWENPQVIIPENSYFPKVVTNEDVILAVWQEYSQGNETYTLKGISSTDGIQWSEPTDLIGPIGFATAEPVSLFSLIALGNGDFLMAFPRSANSMMIYRASSDLVFREDGEISSEKALLAPQLFENESGDPVIFMTQDLQGVESIAGGLSIFYSQRFSNRWSNPAELVPPGDLNLNLLPHYHSFNGYEYVVFQSLYTGTRITWQLYMMRRPVGENPWEAPMLLTNFSDGEPDRLAEFFSNQRPYLYDDGSSLYVSWERNYTLQSPQVFVAEINEEGSIVTDSILQITSGFRFNAFPRLFSFDNQQYVSWFDNRQGNQVVFDRADRLSYNPVLLSTGTGESSYGEALEFKGDLYFFWENKFRNENRLVMLSPDKSVDSPIIQPLGIRDGERRREMMVNVTWKAPIDSSGIQGYRYLWNKMEVDDPSITDQRLLLNPQMLTLQAEDDGLWYLHLAAQDKAGNWSDTVTFSYNRDRTPPGQVEFIHAPTDEYAALQSNSMEIAWRPPPEEDVAGYSYRLNYIGPNMVDPLSLSLPNPDPFIGQTQRAMRFQNRDNGYWVLSVIAIDSTGNVGRPSEYLFKLNKYIPVTYISWVSSDRDEMDRILLNIRGRGFSAGGNINRIILDEDGQEPFDYIFYPDEHFNVANDRNINGPRIDFMDAGIYRLAVEHPQRGRTWARRQLSLDSTGTVKYGDFSREPSEIWQRLEDRAIRILLNDWSLYLLMLFLTLVLVVSAIKARNYFKEGLLVAANSKALVYNLPTYSDQMLEEARLMKRKGLRLRAKFTLALLSLVIAIVLMVALFLGRYMITSQQLTLGQELEKRSSMLLDTLVNGGQNNLPTEERIQLRRLPGQIVAMEEALWTTIVGKGVIDPDNYNYIWASNDPEINGKQVLPEEIDLPVYQSWIDTLQVDEAYIEQWYDYSNVRWSLNENGRTNGRELAQALHNAELLGDFIVGQTNYTDEVDPFIAELEREINETAQQRIGDLKQQWIDLGDQAQALYNSGVPLEEIEEFDTQQLIDDQINDILVELSREQGIEIFPSYNPEELAQLNMGEGEFIFYKPIIYSEGANDRYFKGAVRLAISVDILLEQLTRTRLTIYRITAIAFVAALLLGLAGALFLSTSMSRPIKELAKHVQIISETEDKKKLKNHIFPVKSADEIGDLGNIINNMTHGLVEAAKANEDLMAGKDIQKAFIPLEMSKISDRKHTTGKYEDDDVLIFGYYEGAKTVSGDYFDFRQLDDEHFAIIKCDIAGKGVAASLIMVEVATIFVNYFRSHKPKIHGVNLAELVWNINDLLNEVGFAGRFAAFNIVLLNKRTGQTWMCHAGDREVNMYDSAKGKMWTKMLNDVPTAGSIDSDLLKMQGMEYIQTPHLLKHKDRLFLYTDGIEEAQNIFRDSSFKHIDCDGSCGATDIDPARDDNNTTNHIKGESFEEFTTVRVFDVIEHVLERKEYVLTKYHDPLGEDHRMIFDYTNSEGSAEEAVLALIAAQFVFQLVPDPNATELDRVMIDRRVDDFLKKYFVQYRDYFKYPQENLENGEYIYYTHMKKDDQTDDLTILVVEKK